MPPGGGTGGTDCGGSGGRRWRLPARDGSHVATAPPHRTGHLHFNHQPIFNIQDATLPTAQRNALRIFSGQPASHGFLGHYLIVMSGRRLLGRQHKARLYYNHAAQVQPRDDAAAVKRLLESVSRLNNFHDLLQLGVIWVQHTAIISQHSILKTLSRSSNSSYILSFKNEFIKITWKLPFCPTILGSSPDAACQWETQWCHLKHANPCVTFHTIVVCVVC